MRAMIDQEKAKVYAGTGFSIHQIAELGVGGVVELGAVRKQDDLRWVDVSLEDGRSGIMPAETKVLEIQRAYLDEKDVAAYSEPSLDSKVVCHYATDSELDIIGRIMESGHQWIRLREKDGTYGFIEGTSRIKPLSIAQMKEKDVREKAKWERDAKRVKERRENVRRERAEGLRRMAAGVAWMFGGFCCYAGGIWVYRHVPPSLQKSTSLGAAGLLVSCLCIGGKLLIEGVKGLLSH